MFLKNRNKIQLNSVKKIIKIIKNNKNSLN